MTERHYADRIGADTALCGENLSVAGARYTTKPERVTCTYCLDLLP